MAEMSEASEHKKGGGKAKAKKHSTRIDMTPMVDLGFLLVTFFIFTTTLSKPTTMDLVMPADKEEPKPTDTKVNNKEVLVLLLGDKNVIYYYTPNENLEIDELLTTDYSAKGLRKLLNEKKKEVEALGPVPDKDGKPGPRKITVLVKPTDKSRYVNFIDVLDEIKVSDISKYVVVPPEQPELDKIRSVTEN